MNLFRWLTDRLFALIDDHPRTLTLRVTLLDPSARYLADWLTVAGLRRDEADVRAAELLAGDAPGDGREIGLGVTVRRDGPSVTITWPYSPDAED